MQAFPRVAAIQLNSQDDVTANLDAAAAGLREAAEAGAVLAVLPENCAFMGAHETDKLRHAEPEGDGPVQHRFSGLARELGLWIVAGTVPLAVPGDPQHVYAAQLVFDAQGRCVARYDKIHLFDVDLPPRTLPNGREVPAERYRESNSIAFGSPQRVTVDSPAGRLGLSVCYDLRFPELYRGLASEGAEVLLVPSAFTAKTGEAHWEALLRARAIENQCFVIAPGQCGSHPGGRRTWGHSLIIDPWGVILADAGTAPGVAIADLDAEELARVRAQFPCLKHRRLA